MCGIAGILELGRDTRASAAALREMCRVISHRGPDDDGFYTDGVVGIGMRSHAGVAAKACIARNGTQMNAPSGTACLSRIGTPKARTRNVDALDVRRNSHYVAK